LIQPVKLKDAVVVLKRGRYAVVKQTAKGRGIFLYGCVNGLKESRKYDLLLQDITSYKGRNLYIGDKKIPVYFKNKKLTPKNGSKLKIHYAHLGYYKKLQLVIYGHKDFTVLEK